MIWQYIYNFYVQYIFGGRLSNTRIYEGVLGQAWNTGTNNWGDFNTYTFTPVELTSYGGIIYRMSLGNYLSLIATIITMALIVFFAIWLVRWVFKAVASAFLLK